MFNLIDTIKKFNLPFLSYLDVCIDLGTAHTRIGLKDKGVILREATSTGYNDRSKEYLFFGDEAKKIQGKTPDFIKVVNPVANGVISDFDSEVALMQKLFDKGVGPYLSRSVRPPIRIVTNLPSVATEIEQRAVNELMNKISSVKTYCINTPLAIAHGVGVNIFSHEPSFIIDLGAGLIEMAIISGGGIVINKTLKNAGAHMNQLIYNYCYLKYGIMLGENTVEDLKIKLLTFGKDERIHTVRGKSLENGLPKSIRLKSSEIKEALNTNFNQIIDGARELIELSPPEVVEEIYSNGILLTGGLTECEGIDTYFSQELKIDAIIPENAKDATINGLLSLSKKEEDLTRLATDTF